MNSMALPEKYGDSMSELASNLVNQSNLAIKAYESAIKKAETPEERMYYANLIDQTRKELQIIFVIGGLTALFVLAKYCAK